MQLKNIKNIIKISCKNRERHMDNFVVVIFVLMYLLWDNVCVLNNFIIIIIMNNKSVHLYNQYQ